LPRTQASGTGEVQEHEDQKALRVVLADDHPVYRDGIARVLREHGIDVVAEVGNGAAVVAAVEELAPDVVVMDLALPGPSGIEATRIVTSRAPATHVLVLSVSARDEDVFAAIEAGATGYVLKGGDVEEIVAGVRAAAKGESTISPPVAAILMRSLREEADPPPAVRLSAREHEVLRLMTEGRSNHEIAERLVISELTARNHISNILLKLGVENRVQAAVRAVRNNLL
jgi:DNA-binding NarL/FixJ family response regulator